MARERTLARKEHRELEQYEPWNTFKEMERMFRDFFVSPAPFSGQPRWLGEWRTEYAPEVDLRETDKDLVLSACIPGMEKGDIDVDVTKDAITLSGERKCEEEKPEERFHVRQQSYGSFRIHYALPSEVKADHAKATYRNGVIEVTMPKAEVTEAHKVKVDVRD